jgi:phosphoesterase RecJ-like protein
MASNRAITLDGLELPVPPDEVVAALRAMNNPVLIAHVVPDADALGSMFSLARIWVQGEGRRRVALPEGSLSQRLEFMLPMAEVSVATAEDFEKADGFVVLDTAKLPRCNVGKELKETEWWQDRPIVNIDHHATNTRFGTVNWVVDGASSTSELVCYLLGAAERPVDPAAASMLYAGMLTDTIGFALPTTTPSTMAAAAGLLASGADIGDLGERLRGMRPSEFQLQRAVFVNTKVVADGSLAYSTASYEEIHDAGCTAADIDEQVNIVRSLDGVKLAILFSEGNRGKTRLNLRGTGRLRVLELAKEFNGGGHAQAAGAVIDTGLEEALHLVLPKAEAYVKAFEAEQQG